MVDSDDQEVDSEDLVQCEDPESCIVGPFKGKKRGEEVYICGTENVAPVVDYAELLVR